MTLLLFGLLLLETASGIDFVIRLRMARIGQKKALILGGAFDYGGYLKIRKNHQWSAWPVYIFFLLLVPGAILFCVGLLKINGF